MEWNNNIYQLPFWMFPTRPLPSGENFFLPSLLSKAQRSASLIVFSLNGHIAINKWLNFFPAQGNGKIPPGLAAQGNRPHGLHLACGPEFNAENERTAPCSSPPGLQPDQTSHIPHLVLPQGTCSDSSLARNALSCSMSTLPRELPSYVFFEALIKFLRTFSWEKSMSM